MANAILLAAIVHGLGYGPRGALAVAAIFATATPAWHYSRTIFGEPITTFLWLLAFWALLTSHQSRAKAFLGGMALGASILAKTANILGTAIFPLWAMGLLARPWVESLWPSRQNIKASPRPAWDRLELVAAFIAPLSFFAGTFLWLNWLRFGHPLDADYGNGGEAFTFDYGTSLPALLLSPNKGLFIFAPPILAALVGWPAFWRQHRDMALLAATLGITNWLFYGAWFMWWGGHSWGPRFLVPLISFLLLPLAQALARPSRRILGVVWCSALAGLAINLPGALAEANAYLGDFALVWDPSLWPPLAHLAKLRAGPADIAWARPGLQWMPMFLIALLLCVVTVFFLGQKGKLSLRAADLISLVAIALAFTFHMADLSPCNHRLWQGGFSL